MTPRRPRPLVPWPAQRAAAARAALLDHYGRVARVLPWRRPPGATDDVSRWYILISEFMLQQTTVATVLRRFDDFVARFPDERALAEANDETLYDAWSGLGYYARARRLRDVARAIAANGWPTGIEAWRDLPGVGPYTAAALSSLLHNERAIALDVNIVRVLARLSGFDERTDRGPARTALSAWGTALLPNESPGSGNQALMDLGAMICRLREPDCPTCPLSRWCAALAAGTQNELPILGAKAESKARQERRDVAVVTVRRNSRDALEILIWRHDTPPYAHLWELPTWRGGTSGSLTGKLPAGLGAWWAMLTGMADWNLSSPRHGVRHAITRWNVRLVWTEASPMSRSPAWWPAPTGERFDLPGGTAQWCPLAEVARTVQATPQRALSREIAKRLDGDESQESSDRRA